MSFFSSSPQQRFPDEELDDYIRKTPGKSGSPSKISSVNNSMGEHHNRESPLKHADLSPVYRDQSESLYSSNPTSYFPASPVPKIIITEAMKIGSGRKSKENGLFSPDLHSNLNENYKRGLVMSPPKKGYSPSPKKENIQRSPHKIAELYNSPSKDSNSRRKASENEEQHSGDDLTRSPPTHEAKKPLYEINLGNLRNPPATSYAGAPGTDYGLNTSNRYDNSLVGSVVEINEEEERQESVSKQYNRASLPASPGNRREQFEQQGNKVYATTHSPKAKLRREYEEPIIIQDTPTVYKNIEFKESLAKAFGQADDEGPLSQSDLQEGEDIQAQNFDLRRYRGGNENTKKDLRNQYQSNQHLVIPEVSSRVENLESSMGLPSSQRGSHKQKQAERTNVLQENMLSREHILQTKSAVESPKSHRVNNVRRMSHSRVSSRHSDKDFDSRIENWTVDNFTTFPGGDPQKAAEVQDRANNIIKTLRKSRDKFYDIIFLPNITSLVNSVRQNKRPEWAGLDWHRLSELYKQFKPTLSEEITPLYLKPGLLKNYDFLTVVAALAEYPAIVRNLIHNQTFNNEGCYSVKVCRDGAWKSIVVDDFVPCMKDSNRIPHKPAFLRVQNEDKKIDIWPQIYEKAWAKVFDTYQNLETTSIDQMLRNALGAPVVTHELQGLEETWNILSEAFSQDYIVIASIKDNKNISNQEIYKRGLNPLYGNTILDISLTRTSPSEARTIKLRNIWNEEHAWEGGYKERGSEALEKEKTILMTLQEFCSIFTHLHVSQYDENYVYRSTTMRHVHQAYSIDKFKCDVSMKCFIEAVQIDHRFYRGDPNYQYSTSRILIFKGEGDNWRYFGGNVADTKCNTLKLNLTPGEYYIIGIMDWKDKVHDFTVSAYGEGEVKFERVHYRDNPRLLGKLLESYFLENSIPKTLLKNKDFVKYEKVFEELNGKGELFVNRSTSKVLNIHKKVNKIQNASLLNWTLSNNDDLKMSVQPGSSEVFLFGAEDLTKISTYVSEDIVHETSLR